jgi:hypothetical protein
MNSFIFPNTLIHRHPSVVEFRANYIAIVFSPWCCNLPGVFECVNILCCFTLPNPKTDHRQLIVEFSKDIPGLRSAYDMESSRVTFLYAVLSI